MNANTTCAIADTLSEALYTEKYSNPAANAQENLAGRTHYADPQTLRYHKSRILSARPVSMGAFFLILESCAIDYQNTRRGFRAVLFDLAGESVYRPSLDETHKTRDKASAAFWAWFDGFDELAHYREKLNRRADSYARKIQQMNETAAALALEQDTAAATV
jgi:hypothetical protein